MGAVMPTDVVLCGSMFGLRTYRHRRFTIGPGVPLLAYPAHARHRTPSSRGPHAGRGRAGFSRADAWQAGWNITVSGDEVGRAGTRPMFEAALGIDWVTGPGLELAIPPAYTEWIGAQLLTVI
jgi:DNA (cytosine-5)-methyltransferase 1